MCECIYNAQCLMSPSQMGGRGRVSAVSRGASRSAGQTKGGADGRESQRKDEVRRRHREGDEGQRDILTRLGFVTKDDVTKREMGSCDRAKKKKHGISCQTQNMTEFNFIRLKFFLQEKRGR